MGVQLLPVVEPIHSHFQAHTTVMELNSPSPNKFKAGMTLLEMSIVILVLLALISILFVSSTAWKKGSDRSVNIMNIRNTQQAMRGHQNLQGVKETDVLAQAPTATFTAMTLTSYMKLPIPPSAAIYYSPKSFMTPPSNGVDYAHIWLTPNPAGAPLGEYGQNKLQDSDGW
jgi:prepilin-type N-terminal cleavage/methylation domain-containing protein